MEEYRGSRAQVERCKDTLRRIESSANSLLSSLLFTSLASRKISSPKTMGVNISGEGNNSPMYVDNIIPIRITNSPRKNTTLDNKQFKYFDMSN